MKNTLNYSSGAQTLLANVNDSTNRIFINGTEIPSADWTGTGTFTYSVEGATISIQRIADDSGNIMLQKVDTDSYRLIRKEESSYLTTTGDTKDNVVTFTSADDDSVFNSGNLAGQSAYVWNAVATMASAEKHSSLFNKISTMFKNIRTIAKLLGTTDISSIGGGTISGAINALNVSLMKKVSATGAFTSSTSQAYTGVSITIPKCRFFILFVKADFAYSAPEVVSICPNSSSYSELVSNARGEHNATVILVGSTNAETTYYVWARYKSAARNEASATAYYSV